MGRYVAIRVRREVYERLRVSADNLGMTVGNAIKALLNQQGIAA